VNALQEKYTKDIEAVLKKYPSDRKRSAVMPLLYLAQREGGFITKQDMADIGEILGSTQTEVASIVGFYTLYRDEQAGKYVVQVCTDMPCSLRGAEEFLEKLCDNLGIQVSETTEDGLVTIEEVKCLAGCDKAPMFQVQTGDDIAYHENQTVESTMELIEKWRKEEK
jgi:NADH-quinone oxidoreductase subunit E